MCVTVAVTAYDSGGASTVEVHVQWSPLPGEDDDDVFVMDADGANRRQLTDSPGYDGHASWSVDGTRILFNSDRKSPDLSVG